MHHYGTVISMVSDHEPVLDSSITRLVDGPTVVSNGWRRVDLIVIAIDTLGGSAAHRQHVRPTRRRTIRRRRTRSQYAAQRRHGQRHGDRASGSHTQFSIHDRFLPGRPTRPHNNQTPSFGHVPRDPPSDPVTIKRIRAFADTASGHLPDS